MAKKSDVPPIPSPEGDEPKGVPPVEAAPAAAAPTTPTPPTPPTPPVNPYAPQPEAYSQPNPYAAAGGEQPNPYAAAGQPNPYGAGAQQPYAYGAYAPQPPKGLSITSMILGIAGIVFCGTFALVSIAAVITGHMAARSQPYAKGMWLTGLITGYVGIAFGLLVVLLWFGLFAATFSYGY